MSRSPKAGRKSININDAATIAQMAALGSDGPSQEAVRVIARVRPFNAREVALHQKTLEGKPAWEQYGIRSVVEFSGNTCSVLDPEKEWSERQRFAFDGCLWSIPESIQPSRNPFASQEALFNEFGKPMLEQAWKGFNTCFLAYGQTGSGKTYSMMGQPVDTPTEKADPGLIPRLCQALFEQIEAAKIAAEADRNYVRSYKVTVQYLEIYNEAIKDLLWARSELPPATQAKINPDNLKLRGGIAGTKVFVEYLTSITVTNWMQMLELIDIGNQCRTTAATSMNERSSRSHAVFKVNLTQTTTSVPKKQFEKPTEHVRESQINMVDLAGSERNKKTGAVGDRLKEAGSINKSLSTLKAVIDALVENSRTHKAGFVPYRDSILTHTLMDSLGGNSKTFMLVTISPHVDNIEETSQTLQYGAKARQIINTVRVNENAGARLLMNLEEELKQMKEEMQKAATNAATTEELVNLQAQIKEHENNIAAARSENEEQRKKIEVLIAEKQNLVTSRHKRMMADIERVGHAQSKKTQAAELELTLRREVSDLNKTILTLRNKQELARALSETVNENIAKLKDQSTSHRFSIQQLQRQQTDAASRLWSLKHGEETTRFACQKAAKDRIDFMLRNRLAMAREKLSYLRKRKEREQVATEELQQLQDIIVKQRIETEEQQSAALAEEEHVEANLRQELKKLEGELESANAERERQLRLVSEKYSKLERENGNAIKMKEQHCTTTKSVWGKRRENMTREIENQYRDVLTKSAERHAKEQEEADKVLRSVKSESNRSLDAHNKAWEARVHAVREKNANDLADAKDRWENLLNDRRRQMQALRYQLHEVETKETEHLNFSKKVAAVLSHVPKPVKGQSNPAAVKLFELLEYYLGQYEEDKPNIGHLRTLLTKDTNANRCSDPPALGLDDTATTTRPSYPALDRHHADANEPVPSNPSDFERSLSNKGNPQPTSLRRRTPSMTLHRPHSPLDREPDLFLRQADGEGSFFAAKSLRPPTPTRSQLYSPQQPGAPAAQIVRRSATPSRSALFFSARLRSKSPVAGTAK